MDLARWPDTPEALDAEQRRLARLTPEPWSPGADPLCVAGASYDPGRLARREGPGLAAAVDALTRRPDVLLVDATGRDHPRHAGLALHLGAVLDLPTVGVTHRALRAEGGEPGPEPGDAAPLVLDGEIVAFCVRTRRGVRPVVAHAGWRTDAQVARDLVLRCTGAARTPEPLRRARDLARTARARAEGRASGGPGSPR